MNETYRISESSLRTRQRAFAFVPIVAILVVIAQGHKDPSHPIALIFTAIVICCVGGYVSWRRYQDFAQFARTHSLRLENDALLFRDGDTERRVPYATIEKLVLKTSLFKSKSIVLKCRDLPEEILEGYENFPQLISRLASKVPGAKLSG